jgi:hypothetical protein
MQDTSLIYKDQILTNVFLAYPSQGFVAEEVLPTLNVPDLTGIAFKLDEAHLRVPPSSLRAAYARANRVDYTLTSVAYGPLLEHTLEGAIPDAVMRLYKEPLTPETTSTNVVSKQLLNEKEVAVMTMLTTLANYPTANKVTLSGTSQFDNAASDPVAVATVARRAVKLGCGSDANIVVMNPDVRDSLRNNAAVKARIQYAAKLTRDELDAQIADLLGVDRIVVASAVKTDQAEGSTTAGTKSYIWGDDMLFAYVTAAPALEELSLGYNLRLNPEHTLDGPAGKEIFVGVDKWYEQQRKTTIVRANDFYLPWQVANTAGYLVKDCTAAY